MRLILLTSKLNFLTAGGSVHDLDIKAEELVRQGFDVRVMTAYSQSNKFGERKPSYSVIEEHFDSHSLFALQASTRRALRKYENETDLFYVEGQFGFGAGLYKVFSGKRPVLCFCNVEVSSWLDQPDPTPTLKRKIKRFLRRQYENTIGAWLMDRLDYFIFTAPSVKKKYRMNKVRGEPHVILPDFVDAEGLRRRTGTSRDGLLRRAEKKNKLVVLTSGRMIDEKGFDLVVNAAAELADKSIFEIVMCGGGSEEENLKNLAKQRGVEGLVTFAGWQDRGELLSKLAQCDIFILPKWRAHLTSVMLLEAMALGAPCIVPAGHCLDWLAGPAALKFAYDDPLDLARQIDRLGQDDRLRATLSKNALDRMEEFSPPRMGAKMGEIIQGLLSSKG